MIQHPKHVILLELQEAGVPNENLHELTDRIGEAYEEANGESEATSVAGLHVEEDPTMPEDQVEIRGRNHSVRFELVDQDVTERDEPAPERKP